MKLTTNNFQFIKMKWFFSLFLVVLFLFLTTLPAQALSKKMCVPKGDKCYLNSKSSQVCEASSACFQTYFSETHGFCVSQADPNNCYYASNSECSVAKKSVCDLVNVTFGSIDPVATSGNTDPVKENDAYVSIKVCAPKGDTCYANSAKSEVCKASSECLLTTIKPSQISPPTDYNICISRSDRNGCYKIISASECTQKNGDVCDLIDVTIARTANPVDTVGKANPVDTVGKADPVAPYSKEITNPLGEGTTLNSVVGKAINSLMGIVGALALLMFVYGGLTWMTSSGSQDKVKKGKDIMIWAAVGLIVIFSAYGLTKFVINVVTK